MHVCLVPYVPFSNIVLSGIIVVSCVRWDRIEVYVTYSFLRAVSIIDIRVFDFIILLTCITRNSPTAQYRHMCNKTHTLAETNQPNCMKDNSPPWLTTWIIRNQVFYIRKTIYPQMIGKKNKQFQAASSIDQCWIYGGRLIRVLLGILIKKFAIFIWSSSTTALVYYET